MMLKLTPSKKYRIIDITEFQPEIRIPSDYLREAEEHGPWFFIPAHWNEDEGWGSWIGLRQNYPILYSTSFQTSEEAMEAAIEWEAGEEEREARKANWKRWID
jgi:hypothetical protein